MFGITSVDSVILLLDDDIIIEICKKMKMSDLKNIYLLSSYYYELLLRRSDFTNRCFCIKNIANVNRSILFNIIQRNFPVFFLSRPIPHKVDIDIINALSKSKTLILQNCNLVAVKSNMFNYCKFVCLTLCDINDSILNYTKNCQLLLLLGCRYDLIDTLEINYIETNKNINKMINISFNIRLHTAAHGFRIFENGFNKFIVYQSYIETVWTFCEEEENSSNEDYNTC